MNMSQTDMIFTSNYTSSGDFGDNKTATMEVNNFTFSHNFTLGDFNASNITENATNVTDCFDRMEHYSQTSIVLVGFITLFVIIFGIIANALNLRIFTHRFMRVSLLNWYLAVLSVSDTIILVTGFFFLCLPRLAEYSQNYDVSNFTIRIVPLNYPLALIAQTASVWLTILMSTHRFVGVCLPFKTARICTKRNCMIALLIVLLFALIFNITRFLEVEVNVCYSNIINYTLLEPAPSSLRLNDTYTHYIVWSNFIFMFLLPFLLLICLNTAVIMAIRNTSKLHLSVAAGSEQMMTSKKKEISKEISTSIMLVGVVIVFLICNTLAFVVNLMELIDKYVIEDIIEIEDDKRFTRTDTYHSMVDVSNLLVMVNSSINIFIYCSFSEKFRLLLKHYLTCSCYNNAEPLIDTTMTTHA